MIAPSPSYACGSLWKLGRRRFRFRAFGLGYLGTSWTSPQQAERWLASQGLWAELIPPGDDGTVRIVYSGTEGASSLVRSETFMASMLASQTGGAT